MTLLVKIMATKRFYATEEWKKLRRMTLKRDGYTCRVRGCKVKGANSLTVHHVIPRNEGGDDHTRNLITLCPKHHDEIEIAGVRQIYQIERWEYAPENPHRDVSSTILDTLPQEIQQTKQRHVSGRHVCDSLTVGTVNRLKRNGWTWTELAKELGYDPSFSATLSAIARDRSGAITTDGEEELRKRLELIPLNTIKRCTTCGGAHPASGCPGSLTIAAPLPESDIWLPEKKRKRVKKENPSGSLVFTVRQPQQITISPIEAQAIRFKSLAAAYGKRNPLLFAKMLSGYMDLYGIVFYRPAVKAWSLVDDIAHDEEVPHTEAYKLLIGRMLNYFAASRT